MNCPLCRCQQVKNLAAVQGRIYFECPECALVFLNPDQLPTAEEERDRYLKHRNSPADESYREYLLKAIVPLVPHLKKADRCLDYGSGPQPVLCELLRGMGHDITPYDPLFSPDTIGQHDRFDAITCIETVEHFHHPAREWKRLNDLLCPGGKLFVHTNPRNPDIEFSSWWYARDITHTVFYSRQTMEWISDHFNWRRTAHGDHSFLFYKAVPGT